MINYMKLIVGLGNPGKEYEHTRHNMGYDVVDLFASSLGFDIDKVGFKGLYTKVKYFNEDIILLKPTTYMNLSGDSIVLLKNYFKIDIEDIIIIYDDMDTKVGNIRLKIKGSSGGHNGIKSIIANLKTEEFKRIRVGIGKPLFNIIDYVLSKPSSEEQELINKALQDAVDALKISIKESFNKAMTIYNKENKL
ncbi:MAG: aminoacyl-tRNA hydrolase [Candidatus Onthovivens sp.]